MTVFCPKCGNAVKDGLKFCNSCGQRLRREANGGSNANGTLLILLGAATVITVTGLGSLIGFVALLLKNGVKEELLAMAMMMWLFVLLVIDIMLIRKAAKVVDHKLNETRDDDIPVVVSQPLQMASVPTGQLEEYHQPAGSVIDHTTRMLEKEPFRER